MFADFADVTRSAKVQQKKKEETPEKKKSQNFTPVNRTKIRF